MRDGSGRAVELSLVLTTVPDRDTGEKLVHALLEERLVACGNLLPDLVSLYRWKGELARETEVLVLLKTQPGLVQRAFERIAELHPYEVPELVAFAADQVSSAYSGWVSDETIEVSA